MGPSLPFNFHQLFGPKCQPVNANYHQAISPRTSPERIPASSKRKERQRGTTSLESNPSGPSDTLTESQAESPIQTDDARSNQNYLQYPNWPSHPTDNKVSTKQVSHVVELQSTSSGIAQSHKDSIDVVAILNTVADDFAMPTESQLILPTHDYQLAELTPDIAMLEGEQDTDSSDSELTSTDKAQPDDRCTPINKEDEIADDPEADADQLNQLILSTPPMTAKRTATDISPVSPMRTRSKQKRQIITDDDRLPWRLK